MSALPDWIQGIDWVGLFGRATPAALRILGILVTAHLALRLTYLVVARVFDGQGASAKIIRLDERRTRTLGAILRSLARYTVYVLATLAILQTILGREAMAPVLAGAGIVGLAVGFGAQNLIRDLITGFFIIFEDQYSVGDYITAAGVSGFVEEIGLRITRLRDFSGEVHVIPNGIIDRTTNISRGPMRALVEVGVAYEEDLDRVIKLLAQVADEAARDLADVLTEPPKVLGVTRFGESEVTLQILARSKPMEQWRVERELRYRIKEAFDREGIEIPYARRVILPVRPTRLAGVDRGSAGSAIDPETRMVSEVRDRTGDARRDPDRPAESPAVDAPRGDQR